jgi:hypothetical protein
MIAYLRGKIKGVNCEARNPGEEVEIWDTSIHSLIHHEEISIRTTSTVK